MNAESKTYQIKPSSEKEFTIAVLALAKEFYGDDAKYLQTSRMVKLVALVADEIGYNLTKGWYKYGYFSPTAWEAIREYAISEPPNLATFEPPNELVTKSLENFKSKIDQITRSVNDLKAFFTLPREEFFDWVYGEKTPPKYRELYMTHRNFQRLIEQFILCLSVPTAFKDQLEKIIPRLEELVGKYHDLVKRIEDNDTLDLFYDYMDLIEMVAFKIENKNYLLDAREMSFLSGLKEFYINENSEVDMWMLLVPYAETLSGPKANIARERYIEKVFASKKFLEELITRLFDDAKKLGLLPSVEEQWGRIKRASAKYPGRKPIREIYESF